MRNMTRIKCLAAALITAGIGVLFAIIGTYLDAGWMVGIGVLLIIKCALLYIILIPKTSS